MNDYISGKLIIEYAGQEHTFHLHMPIKEDPKRMAIKAELPVSAIYLPMLTADSRWGVENDD